MAAERDPHLDLMDEWEANHLGITGVLPSFTPGISARRVAVRDAEDIYQPYIQEGDENYAEMYIREEENRAIAVSHIFYFYGFV